MRPEEVTQTSTGAPEGLSRHGTSLWPTQPLNVIKPAAHMGVEIISAGDLMDLARFEEPERIQAYSFSAATFEVADRMTIVFSPLRIPRPPG